MKKIFNGRLYNTDTAKLSGRWDNGYCHSDFNYCSEDLYCKKTGEFFLYGFGGPFTRYAISDGNSTCSGHDIIPLTKKEAMMWAEKHLTADVYMELFDTEE